jgi:hypothetical protein
VLNALSGGYAIAVSPTGRLAEEAVDNAYRTLLGDRLLGLPGASESRSYVVMEEIKESLALTVPD